MDRPEPVDGRDDIRRAADSLARRLPPQLGGLARLAYNYRWSWMQQGELFRAVDEPTWERCRGNPVRLLIDSPPETAARAAGDGRLCVRIEDAVRELDAHLASGADPATAQPVCFICAEFGIHVSLPVYAGGLGVLAGDILKEASDRGLPMVGMGLLYRQGYFRQRMDLSGWQHEYWVNIDPARLPTALVRTTDRTPLTVRVPMPGRDVVVQIWRIDVGRVPLFLLDADRPENRTEDRWITSRLYVANREMRLAQYALLGKGSVRALAALGITPSLLHLNEGHATFASLEMAADQVQRGHADARTALADARQRTIFTTHTPVAAGNEVFDTQDIAVHLGDIAERLGLPVDGLISRGRVREDDGGEPFGLTPLGIRSSRSTNAVSRRHGEVARSMWQPMFPGRDERDVPITHVTNGVHLPTWMSPAMLGLLDAHLGDGWRRRAADPQTWEAVDAISDAELWRVRRQLRAELVAYIRERSVVDRLARGEPLAYVGAAARSFDEDVLTVGFARRLATYKRLHLLLHDADRAIRLLGGDRPVQVVLAGKAHPEDDAGKRVVQGLFAARRDDTVAGRVTFLEDYDLAVASRLVAGCDLWVNLPRAPLEASGTSGMKAALNGALNLSIADGWWAEAYNGVNGWTIAPGTEARDDDDADAADSTELYRLLEDEVVPLFYAREDDGVPRGWIDHMRASLRSIAPAFCASRMLADYETDVYGAVVGRPAAVMLHAR